MENYFDFNRKKISSSISIIFKLLSFYVTWFSEDICVHLIVPLCIVPEGFRQILFLRAQKLEIHQQVERVQKVQALPSQIIHLRKGKMGNVENDK